MYKTKITIVNANGLHARPASKLVQLASRFKSEVYIETGEKRINLKSMMALLSSGIRNNSNVVVCAEGEDEKEAVEALVGFIGSLEDG